MTRVTIALVVACAAFAQQRTAPARPAAKSAAPKPQATKAPPAPSTAKSAAAGQKKTPSRPPRLPAAETDYRLGLSFPAPKELRIPASETRALSNGVKLVLSPDPAASTVTGLIRVGAGTANDPPAKLGLAELTGHATFSGAAGGPQGNALTNTLESLGVSMRIAFGGLFTSLYFEVPDENLPATLDLLLTTLTKPAFDLDTLETLQAAARDRITGRNANAGAVASREFRRSILGRGSLLVRQPDLEHLDNIGREDLVTFHAAHYSPASATVALHGDFAPAETEALVSRLTGGWHPSTAPRQSPPLQFTSEPPATQVIPSGEAVDTIFLIGHATQGLAGPDAAAFYVLAEILAGGRETLIGKMFDTQRASWRARITASFEAPIEGPAYFVVGGSVEPGHTIEVIRLAREKFEALVKGEFTQEEVESARLRALTRYSLQFSSGGDLFRFARALEDEGLPAGLPRTIQNGIAAIDRTRLAKVAREILKPTELRVVAAGNTILINQPLDVLGLPVSNVDLKIPGPRPVTPDTNPESLARGKAWLARLQQALGGTEKLAAIKDLTARWDTLVFAPQGKITLKQTDRWLADGVFRQDQEGGAQPLSLYYDGKIGWLGRPKMVAPLPPDTLAEVRSELFRVIPRIALMDRRTGCVVSHEAANIVVIADNAGNAARIYYDEASGLPSRIVYQLPRSDGPSHTVEETWSEWRDIPGGTRLPGFTRVKRNGRKLAELRLVEAKANSGITAAQISQKP